MIPKIRAKKAKSPPSAVTLRASLRGALVRALESGREAASQDGGAMLRNERLWAKSPTAAAKTILAALDDVPIAESVRKLFHSTRASLGSTLGMRPLDELDGESLLEWLQGEVPLSFSDDTISLPVGERVALEAALTRAVEAGVSENIGMDAFVDRMGRAIRDWAHEASVPEAPLARVKPTFDGVWAIRRPEEQRAFVANLVAELSVELCLHWVAPPKPTRDWDPDAVFDVGDGVRHARFGEGVVVERLDGKLGIRFGEDVRRMAWSGRAS
jgi:hypothetical protein